MASDWGMSLAVFDTNKSIELKNIMGTHAPAADCDNLDVTPILNIIQDVLDCKAPTNHEEKPLKDNTTEAVELNKTLTSIIQKVSSEITCKCFAGDVRTTTMTLLRMLSSYEWGAKVAIALGALAIAYGEFRLVVQSFRTEPTDCLAKSVAKLKQLPTELKTKSEQLETPFKDLIIAMLRVTKTILDFKQQISRANFAPNELPLYGDITRQISLAASSTIKTVVVCALQIANLISNSYEHTTTTSTTHDMEQLLSLREEKEKLHTSLEQHLKQFKRRIDDKMLLEEYTNLVNEIKSSQHDSTKIIGRLINNNKDGKESKPLYKGFNDSRVQVDEVLKGKIVLLLISNLTKLFDDELDIMNRIYDDSTSKSDDFQYEIVWVPVIEETNIDVTWKENYEKIKKKMRNWYILHEPEGLQAAVKKYIKEEWEFSKETILVVLESNGNVASKNAFNQYLIWGNKAIPSILNKDDEAAAPWCDENQKPIDLFFKGINSDFDKWIKEGYYICVYGGGDLEKMYEFAKKAPSAMDKLGKRMKIIYAGKSNETKKSRETRDAIKKNLQGSVHVIDSMRQFWVRLKCVLYSKSQLGSEKVVKRDLIMKQVIDVLNFDGSDQVWALWFAFDDKIGGEMTSFKGDAVLKSVANVENWKESAKNGRVIPALEAYVKQISKQEHHCNKITIRGDKGGIPKSVYCECGNEMEIYFTYRCCPDETSVAPPMVTDTGVALMK